jgi:hypothetical protein
MRRGILCCAALAGLAGCAGKPATPPVRFANAPAASVVDDRRDVPRRPKRRTFLVATDRNDSYVRALTRVLELPRHRRALGVNALDEVPDSTWFTNRIGVRDLSLEELRTGPARAGSPEPHKPWTIHSTKIGGSAVGFIITDARGEKYLLKLEAPGFFEIETGAAAIVNRLIWAAGYNVPEDHVVYLRPEDLVLAPDAKIKDAFGNESPLDRAELERRMALVERVPDGRLRGLASRMLDGAPLGGHPPRGVRKDDPNDRIPHELRRDLRGAYVFYSWLDQTDIKEDNTLDMWVADPADPKRHYVKHYLIDFGKSLGAMATTQHDPRRGLHYRHDATLMLTSLVTLGLAPRKWERRVAPEFRGLGLYETTTFDPGAWKPDSPAYLPFRTADAYDKLWAAKILMRFSPEHIRAVVETARYSDPRTARYIADTIIARQRATARHWFWRVSPLDRFDLASGQLCFDDLMIVHDLAPVAQATRYTVTAYDRHGRRIGAPLAYRANQTGHSCVGPVALAGGGGGDGYTIFRIDTERLHFRGTTFVHAARASGADAPRVIGIWRQ